MSSEEDDSTDNEFTHAGDALPVDRHFEQGLVSLVFPHPQWRDRILLERIVVTSRPCAILMVRASTLKNDVSKREGQSNRRSLTSNQPMASHRRIPGRQKPAIRPDRTFSAAFIRRSFPPARVSLISRITVFSSNLSLDLRPNQNQIQSNSLPLLRASPLLRSLSANWNPPMVDDRDSLPRYDSGRSSMQDEIRRSRSSPFRVSSFLPISSLRNNIPVLVLCIG